MAEYVEILRTSEMNNEQMKGISVRGRGILLARVNDKFYAVNNTCPHMGAGLADGTIKGTVVTCPRHASQFDIRDGHIVRWTDWSGTKLAISKILRSPRPLQTYPVKVEEDRVLVET